MCSNERFDFRPGSSTLIPYYKVPLRTAELSFAIHEVVVGPTPNPVLSATSVKSFLVSRSLGNVPVVNSEVPYRNW
jgi:hypothetical protein